MLSNMENNMGAFSNRVQLYGIPILTDPMDSLTICKTRCLTSSLKLCTAPYKNVTCSSMNVRSRSSAHNEAFKSNCCNCASNVARSTALRWQITILGAHQPGIPPMQKIMHVASTPSNGESPKEIP